MIVVAVGDAARWHAPMAIIKPSIKLVRVSKDVRRGMVNFI